MTLQEIANMTLQEIAKQCVVLDAAQTAYWDECVQPLVGECDTLEKMRKLYAQVSQWALPYGMPTIIHVRFCTEFSKLRPQEEN